jgi:hypothetical protein
MASPEWQEGDHTIERLIIHPAARAAA